MTLPKINLSINPSYHCNFRCNWCYLTPKQLAYKDNDLYQIKRYTCTHTNL